MENSGHVRALEIERDDVSSPEIAHDARMTVSAPAQPQAPPPPRQSVVREAPVDRGEAVAKAEAFHSAEIDQIITALAVAQGEFDVVEKNKHADIKSRREGGASYSYDYEDLASVLAAVRPALSRNALALVQLPTTLQNGVVVLTMLAHGPSGQWIRNRLALRCDPGDAQAVGSAISYARRYSVKAMLGLASEDDDGARASASTEKRREAPRPAQRKSQASAQPLAPPVVDAPPAASPEPEGLRVVAVQERPGGWLIRFSDNRAAATKDRAMADAARRLCDAGTLVDVEVRPAADPTRYAPFLTELTPLR